MTYRVEQLAASGGVSVDTVRYYQGLGLLPPPRRDGRVVLYEESHLRRLRRIRSLADSGFTLRQIGDLVDTDNGRTDPLLEALSVQAPGGASLSLDEVAERTGVDASLLSIGVDAGLLRPEIVDGEARFDEGQAEMVATVGSLLESGVDLEPLVALAQKHAENIEELVSEAVNLYRSAVSNQPDRDRERIAGEIRGLVPAVTSLVADHFSRTLVRRASEFVDEKPAS